MEIHLDDLKTLEAMIDAYSLQSVLSGLSHICSEKSIHIAVNWQDAASAKGWMAQSKQIDDLVAKWERKEKGQ